LPGGFSDSRIRIAHVLATLGRGGSELRLLDYLGTSSSENLEHYVCCVTRGGPLEAEFRKRAAGVFIARRRFRFDLGVIGQLKSFFEEKRIDIVHCRNFTANLWGRISARLAGVKVVLAGELGTAWTETGLMRNLDRMLSNVTTAYTPNSLAAREVLVRTGTCRREKTMLIREGVFPEWSEMAKHPDPSLRKALGLPADAKLIAITGRLVGTKGVNFALEAMKEIASQFPGARLVVAGDGPQREALERKALSAGVSGRVIFLGFCERNAELMRSVDLVVSCSIHDCLPGSLIEAGLMSKPVVATRVDGIPEIVVEGETGLLVEPSIPLDGAFVDSTVPAFVFEPNERKLGRPLAPDPKEIAAAVCKLLADRGAAESMGMNARRVLEPTYTAERSSRIRDSYYEECIC